MARPDQIAAWLAGSAIAIVGISVVPHDVTQRIFAALLSRGHRVFPVRGGVKYIDGHRAFARVQDIPERVDGALVIAPPRTAERMVADCIEARVSHIWIDHHAYAPGSFALDLTLRPGTDMFIADAAAELLPLYRRRSATIDWLAAHVGLRS